VSWQKLAGRVRQRHEALYHRFITSGQPIQMIASAFELIIFDCDGVLVDSEPIINRAHAMC
jgi:hypothetical protein